MPGTQDATPWGAIADGAQTLLGIGQTLFSGKHKAEKDLENYANSYVPNQSIQDYYNKALAKYNPNAYQSAEYQNRANINSRNLTTGINAASDRRAGVGALSGLVQGADDANANAASQAEAAQRGNLGQLGAAAGAKSAEDSKKYDLKYNLLAMKAGGANANQSAGIKNIFGGLQGVSDLEMAKQLYGDGGTNLYNSRNSGLNPYTRRITNNPIPNM